MVHFHCQAARLCLCSLLGSTGSLPLRAAAGPWLARPTSPIIPRFKVASKPVVIVAAPSSSVGTESAASR